MREQIARIPVLVENAVIRHFGDAGRATEPSPGTKVNFVIQTVVTRALAKGYQSATFLLQPKTKYTCVYQSTRALMQMPKNWWLLAPLQYT